VKTVKKLTLMRHGKANPGLGYKEDFNRKLSENSISFVPGMMAEIAFDLSEWKILINGSGYLEEVLQ
jgi:hypothetical protein